MKGNANPLNYRERSISYWITVPNLLFRPQGKNANFFEIKSFHLAFHHLYSKLPSSFSKFRHSRNYSNNLEEIIVFNLFLQTAGYINRIALNKANLKSMKYYLPEASVKELKGCQARHHCASEECDAKDFSPSEFYLIT